MNKNLKVFLNWRRLRHIKRCNNFPVVNPTDVAQHTYFTTVLAMILVDEYNTYADLNDKPVINSEKVLRKALLHDTDESITSDVPWNVKHITPEINELLVSEINKKIKELYQGGSVIEDYYELSVSCKADLDGAVVTLADMLELAIYCWEEKSMGNKLIDGLLDKCIRLLECYPFYAEMNQASGFFSSTMKLLKYPIETHGELLDIN